MAAKLVFDIETGSLSDDDLLEIVPFVDRKEPPRGNIKLEATWKKKLADWKSPAYKRQREKDHAGNLKKKGALNPLTGYVIAIGVKHGDEENPEVSLIEGLEKKVLTDFWALIGNHLKNGNVAYGYNIKNFDVRFLINRSRVYGIRPEMYTGGLPLINDFGKLPSILVDIGQQWAGGYGGFDMPRFEHLCALFGIKAKSQGFRGDSFAKTYRTDPDLAMEYLREEVEALWELSDYFKII